MQDHTEKIDGADMQIPTPNGQPEPADTAAAEAHQKLIEENEALRRELAASAQKTEKLKQYIARVETDGDRLNQKLVEANSYRISFESMANAVKSPLFMVNNDLEIYYANEAFFEITDSSAAILKEKPKCGELLNCGHFRKRCLIQECFAHGKAIEGVECNYDSPTNRRFKLIVDALPILNVANNEILGGIEIFRDLTEDTRRQYMMFSLNGSEYGVSINKVLRIIPRENMTSIPNVPDCISGVINVHGQAIYVINMGAKLGLSRAEAAERSCIVILRSGMESSSTAYGFLADQVNGILTINTKDITFNLGSEFGNETDCIAIAKVGNSTRVLIDIERLLGDMNWKP